MALRLDLDQILVGVKMQVEEGGCAAEAIYVAMSKCAPLRTSLTPVSIVVERPFLFSLFDRERREHLLTVTIDNPSGA